MPPAYIGLAPDAPRYCSARCRPCGRRFAAYERQSPLRLRSMAPLRSPSLRLRSRCALRSKKPLASSLRAPLTPAATGETCHWHLSPAVRLSRGSPHASLAHAVSARASLAAAQPRSRSTGLRSTGRVAVPGGCKMYIATHTPNPWRARGEDLALRGLLAGLPRAFGTWVPAAPFSGLAASLRQAAPLEYRRGVRVPEPERPFRRKQPASGPFPGMPPWQAASQLPCRAPWRRPAWRSRGQGGCRPP